MIAINFSPANPPSPPQLNKLLCLDFLDYLTYPCAALHWTELTDCVDVATRPYTVPYYLVPAEDINCFLSHSLDPLCLFSAPALAVPSHHSPSLSHPIAPRAVPSLEIYSRLRHQSLCPSWRLSELCSLPGEPPPSSLALGCRQPIPTV